MTALPPSLDRFGPQLESAVRRELDSRRSRRRMARGAAVLAVAAVTALGLLSALGTGGPSVVARAAAALSASDDSILHYRLNAEQQNPDGTSVSWSSETWQLRVSPFTRRQIEVGSDGVRAESVSSGNTNELYDASRNTIYIATSEELRGARTPAIEIVSKSRLEKLTGSDKVGVAYFVGNGAAHPRIFATPEGARRFRQELARQRRRENSSSGTLPDEFRAEILALLRSGRVQDTGHVRVDGRDAIRLESLDGKQVYDVDASTYDPIEWTTSGNGGSVTLRFPVYEELPVDGGSLKLLELEDQHPGAAVVRDVKAYMAAESRLYPHG
jgi:outer membrane lipoprotein-sorting protein